MGDDILINYKLESLEIKDESVLAQIYTQAIRPQSSGNGI
jgi:hypothetical protein